MASVYIRPRSSKWYAQIKTEGGKWKRHPLSVRHCGPGKVGYGVALAEAQRLEELERMKALGTYSLEHASAAWQRTIEQAHGAKLTRVTVRSWLAKWLDMRDAKISERTKVGYESVVKRFLEFLGDKADKPLIGLKLDTLQAHQRVLVEEGLAACTVNIHSKVIGSALERAKKQGLIAENPFPALELMPKDAKVRDVFTLQEMTRILATATGEWKTAILFGCYLGARLGDCTAMKWEGVNLFEGTVTFTPDKQQRGKEKAMTLALHPALHEHLKALAAGMRGAPAGLITPKLARQTSGGREGLSKQFRDILAEAGVKQSTSKLASGRAFSAKTFHSLRHTITTLMMKGGVSAEARMAITGHKSKEVHAIYTHQELEDQRKALAALPSFSG